MFRKFNLLLIVAAFALPGWVFAARDGGAGCGVGAIVMDGKGTKNDHMVASIIETVAAYIFPFQLSGMTSGTLGCDTSGTIEPAASQTAFIEQNRSQFIADVSRGDGEVLTNFMVIVGVETSDEVDFKQTLKNNFAKIFKGLDTSSEDIVMAINQILADDERLVKYVS